MLCKKELESISGGATNWWTTVGIIGGIIAFLSGFLDGFQRPLTCHK